MSSKEKMIEKIEAMQALAKQRKTDKGTAEPEIKKEPERTEGALQLPFWPEPSRAVPNGFLRSALFGAIAKGRRRYINGEEIAAVDGVTIRYKGEQLDQGDLDVWENILHAARHEELGSQCRITSYALLKSMSKTDSGKNRTTLHNRIERLVANALTIKQGRYAYMGSLIRFAAKDEETHEWIIELDGNLYPLFAADQFTQVEWSVRQDLGGKPLAQWLHGFYSSHAKPHPLKIETLLTLAGSENTNPRSAQQKLQKALNEVQDACARHELAFSYEIHGDLVHVKKSPTLSQQRHLNRKKVIKNA